MMFAMPVAAQSLMIPGESATSPALPAAPQPPSSANASKLHVPAKAAEKNSTRHIALLLPLKSPAFGASAEAVRQGFMAAAALEKQPLSVQAYSDFDENNSVTTAYRQAIANGAVAVVGPLTRNGVLALGALKEFPVPTLGLNVAEHTPQPNLYLFGLAVEMEARQVARIARQKELHQAIIVTSRTTLSKRLQAAFEDEWNARGGQILREIEYTDDNTPFEDIAEVSDTVIFLATDVDKARLLRPYLPNRLPIYATSRVFVGNSDSLTNYDLNDIRFVDMPWLLQIDHPAVMTYPRATPPLGINDERLYALGIDAYRLIQLLLAGNVASALPLDGVTGQIQLRGDTFQRDATQATFVQGHAQMNDVPLSRRGDFPDAGK